MVFGSKEQKITLGNVNKKNQKEPEIIYKIAGGNELSGLGKTETKEVIEIATTETADLHSRALPWGDSTMAVFYPFVP